jgi:Uma2 family endonuclease
MRTDIALMTLAEYSAMDESDEEAYVTELVRGVLVKEPRPVRPHGRYQIRLGAALDNWARGVGAEVTAESGYVLFQDPPTLRGPDIGVVVAPRSREEEPPGWTRGAPDVAVEILSPSDTSTAIHAKTLDYLEAGARLVWIVDPAARTVTVYRPDGSARVLRAHETLEGERILDGFSLPLLELFRDA